MKKFTNPSLYVGALELQDSHFPLNKELKERAKTESDRANNLPVKPLGHHVLIEIVPVSFKSAGGIIMGTETEAERERKGRDLAKILAFGPTCYQGFADCKGPEDWGVKVGDTVELSGRYDGKFSSVHEYDKKYKNLRYVSDSDIIGVLSEEIVKQLTEEG
tara:strand:+ start:1250 stop:1732 length:483 start_codon:yes stop_codon:yes gene_type:complete